jgi:hypothetical protein
VTELTEEFQRQTSRAGRLLRTASDLTDQAVRAGLRAAAEAPKLSAVDKRETHATAQGMARAASDARLLVARLEVLSNQFAGAGVGGATSPAEVPSTARPADPDAAQTPEEGA